MEQQPAKRSNATKTVRNVLSPDEYNNVASHIGMETKPTNMSAMARDMTK